MIELQVLRMEQQSLGACSVDLVTDNRGGETVLMGAVDTQLMGASSMRNECDPRPAVSNLIYMIVGHRRLSMLIVDNLPGTVEQIGR